MSPVLALRDCASAVPPKGVPAARPVSRDAFVAAMARAATGVWILATEGPTGRTALTVSAVSSVSADPPMVLACVNRRTLARDAVLEAGVFSLNLLTDEQAALADVFAGRPAEGTPFDFARAEWGTAVTGAPILAQAAAHFDCALSSTVEAGSHSILIGTVVSAARAEGSPLVHTDRRYARAVPLDR